MSSLHIKIISITISAKLNRNEIYVQKHISLQTTRSSISTDLNFNLSISKEVSDDGKVILSRKCVPGIKESCFHIALF